MNFKVLDRLKISDDKIADIGELTDYLEFNHFSDLEELDERLYKKSLFDMDVDAFEFFCKTFFLVKNKSLSSKYIPFTLKGFQKNFIEKDFRLFHENGGFHEDATGIDSYTMKVRQLGMSTLITGLNGFTTLNPKFGGNSLIIAHKSDTSESLLGMYKKQFSERLKKFLYLVHYGGFFVPKKTKQSAQAKDQLNSIIFKTNNNKAIELYNGVSVFTHSINSEVRSVLPVGQTYKFLHFTENYAYTETDVQDLVVGMFGGIRCWESTGKGERGAAFSIPHKLGIITKDSNKRYIDLNNMPFINHNGTKWSVHFDDWLHTDDSATVQLSSIPADWTIPPALIEWVNDRTDLDYLTLQKAYWITTKGNLGSGMDATGKISGNYKREMAISIFDSLSNFSEGNFFSDEDIEVAIDKGQNKNVVFPQGSVLMFGIDIGYEHDLTIIMPFVGRFIDNDINRKSHFTGKFFNPIDASTKQNSHEGQASLIVQKIIEFCNANKNTLGDNIQPSAIIVDGGADGVRTVNDIKIALLRHFPNYQENDIDVLSSSFGTMSDIERAGGPYKTRGYLWASRLRDSLRYRAIALPDNYTLLHQMNALSETEDEAGQKTMLGKKQYRKKNNNRSTDELDALLLCLSNTKDYYGKNVVDYYNKIQDSNEEIQYIDFDYSEPPSFVIFDE